jgi:hypothetical protein
VYTSTSSALNTWARIQRLAFNTSEDYQDIAPLAEETINRILRQKSALELLKFVAESEVDWNKLAVKMLSSTG